MFDSGVARDATGALVGAAGQLMAMLTGSRLAGRIRAFSARVRRSWQCDDYERAIAAELDAHLAFHSADRVGQGLTPSQAAREARMLLGGVLQTRERCLDAMTFRWILKWRVGRRHS
jgi:hypothetical protein